MPGYRTITAARYLVPKLAVDAQHYTITKIMYIHVAYKHVGTRENEPRIIFRSLVKYLEIKVSPIHWAAIVFSIRGVRTGQNIMSNSNSMAMNGENNSQF